MRRDSLPPPRDANTRVGQGTRDPGPPPAPGFGATLHELILQRRLPDGSAWTLAYFAALVGAAEDRVRAWIAGQRPEPDVLARIGEALMVDGPALLRGEVRPMTLPASQRTTGEQPVVPEEPPGDTGETAVREARPRPEYRDLYHNIVPEAWEPAATAADRVLARRLEEGAGIAMMRDRPLSDAHFEFRGGTAKAPTRLARATDTAAT
jgi:hypothetical protein